MLTSQGEAMKYTYKHSKIRPSILTLVALLLSPAIAFAAPEQVVANQYIIQRSKDTPNSQAQTLSAQSLEGDFEVVRVPDRSPLSSSPSINAERIEDVDWPKVRADCDEILKDREVLTCEPDLIREPLLLPNDPGLSLQWWLYDESTVVKGDFGLSTAWERGTGSSSVILGVIDSGVHYTHPDLAPNMWVNPADPIDGIDNDGNGYIDDKLGVNTYYRDNLPVDCSGHGTHVAGIIGAKGNNAIGISGANWTTSIVAVSAQRCGSSGFTLSAILAGYEYLYDLKRRGHNIRAVNASLGGTSPSAAERSALEKLSSVDILLIAAAGNEAKNIDKQPIYPASYDLPNIISVGATNWVLKLANYSNYGESVDIAAPGGEATSEYAQILSTWSPLAAKEVYFKYLQGTSMAAPMVTGTIGLISSQRPYLNGGHLKSMLLISADNKPTLIGLINGGRYLNAARMSLMEDPPDNCPMDPNKLDPALCGCGAPESYIDADSDGVLDCLDGCPADPAKTSPTVCGCGIPDSDANGNAQIDCQEVANATPRALNVALSTPKLKASGKQLIVQMHKIPSAHYFLEVSVIPNKRGKAPKIRIYKSTKSIVRIAKPQRGTKLTMRYYVLMPSSGAQSNWSATKGMRVK
jgi:subtilisin family serine protease